MQASYYYWRVSSTLGFFSFFEGKLGFLILFRRRWKIIISKSWSLPMSAAGKLRVLAIFTPDRKRFPSKMESIWLWCCPSENEISHMCNFNVHAHPVGDEPFGVVFRQNLLPSTNFLLRNSPPSVSVEHNSSHMYTSICACIPFSWQTF